MEILSGSLEKPIDTKHMRAVNYCRVQSVFRWWRTLILVPTFFLCNFLFFANMYKAPTFGRPLIVFHHFLDFWYQDCIYVYFQVL